jgi:hypothetical protein
MDASTINASTFELRDPGNAIVPATVLYDEATDTATLKPNASLALSTTYTVTVKGGIADPRVKDLAGNPFTADVTWAFTTCAACSVWNSSTTPTNPSESDSNPVELGVKFRSDLDGYITGIRFYKGSGNTGTHVGSLWTSTGQFMGSAIFTNETTTGWQQVDFPTPIPVTAGTVYMASYFAPNGHYAADISYFANSGVDNGPIHLLQDGISGGNGVYKYSTSTTFPDSTYQSSNYWVDVVFTTDVGPVPLNVTSTAPTNLSTGVNPGTLVSASLNKILDATTINASNFFLKDASDALVPAALSASGTTATLTPSSTLALSTSYTATLTTGVKDSNGNALPSNYTWSFTTSDGTGGCSSPPNPVVAENCLPGNPVSEWDISGAGDTSIQGFATDISVNRGVTINFKINTNAASYHLDIYRMGYYGGMGARKITTIAPSASLPQTQPACLTNSTGLIDCGNWGVSASWAVPSNATSGIYFARLVRTDTGGASHIVFIVRDDASQSDVLFQTSDTSWQAYNDYGGNNLYTGNGAVGRAYKVSYNRPFHTRVYEPESWVFNSEYPMVRWLEANGYDVSYFTGVDADRNGALINNHKIFMSNGHDEYWSGAQRSNIEASRDAGVHLAFFSGNTMFWKTRWEDAIDGSGTPHRTLVCYKETHANAVIDPQDPPTWTGTWRDPRFSPPADGGRPENAVTGTFFKINGVFNDAITVPQADGRMRFWRNTSIATLGQGQVATLAPGTLGAEVDVDEDNGFRPAGMIGLSNLPITTTTKYLLDYGSTYGAGTAVHKLTLHKAPSGAMVFSTGSYQWSWGLDNNHDRSNLGFTTDVRMQQATVNLFADMGAQPATLQAGLITAIPSTDSEEPASTITSPVPGLIMLGIPVTITGTATDTGGGVVGGVEVSIDGGVSWHPANGRENWSYLWNPRSSATITIKSRAVDDSGNLETPSAGVTVTVGGGETSCTSDCTIWPSAAVPGEADYGPDSAIEVGVKFRADVDGSITGIRFYKAGTNTGTHIGNLWSASGQLLATATFVNETGSGWQQVNFSTPVAITANTVYIASYHTNVGHFAFDQYYFASDGVDSPPLHALQDGVSGPNGVYAYGASQFPTQVYHTTNYWVDVVFDPVASNTAPVASGVYITGIAGVGQTLTGHYTYTDADNDPEGNSTYRWLRDGVAIAGATGTSYLLTIDDLNAVISFEVMPEAQTGELQGTVVANAPDDGPGAVFLGGDITGDGKVDAADVLIVTRILLEGTQQSLTPEEMQIIDVAPLVNGVPDPDGQITAGDLSIITRMALTGTN